MIASWDGWGHGFWIFIVVDVIVQSFENNGTNLLCLTSLLKPAALQVRMVLVDRRYYIPTDLGFISLLM